MNRRRFLRKLLQPQAPGNVFPLQAHTMHHLIRALRQEPEMLEYIGSDDSTTHIYTFHLQKQEGGQPAGALIVSIEINAYRETGEVNLTELMPGRSSLRECLSEVTQFSVDEHQVTFYQPGLSAAIGADYSLRLLRS